MGRLDILNHGDINRLCEMFIETRLRRFQSILGAPRPVTATTTGRPDCGVA
jgi:hypothetical protein